jgi:hypothetical protein
MGAARVLISTQTVGSGGAASVTFSSIPATYTDLKLVASTRSDRTAGSVSNIYLQINSITSSVYSFKQVSGTGSTTDSNQGASVAPTSASIGHTSQATHTANTFGSLEFYIPNYSGSTIKSLSSESVQETNDFPAYTTLSAWLVNNTAAVSSLTLTTTSTFNFAQHSTFSLYGISKS